MKTICELSCNFFRTFCNLLRTLAKPQMRYVRKDSLLSEIPPLSVRWANVAVHKYPGYG